MDGPVMKLALDRIPVGGGTPETAGPRERHTLSDAKIISYSKKVFIPLTRLCRNVCHYCTFAKPPRDLQDLFLSKDQVLAIAREGEAQGCKEALLTLGDKPELRYRPAAQALAALGHATTIDYVHEIAALILSETSLLPHINAGVLSYDDYVRLRSVSPSMGIMLETSARRLSEKGGPHYGSPDKTPEVRLQSIADAGRARIPLTTGILIGIGETDQERLHSLQRIRQLHETYGHIQEIIIQNFVPKPDTLMASVPAPDPRELLATIAAARALFGPAMSIQSPPNLNRALIRELIEAGIDDFGGVSPVTPDHVNPESPWPAIATLREAARDAGAHLCERLTVYPAYVRAAGEWIDSNLRPHVYRHADGDGYAREDRWAPGDVRTSPPIVAAWSIHTPQEETRRGRALTDRFAKVEEGADLSADEIVALFQARGPAFSQIVAFADRLRQNTNGDTITYVVNRNINYTNICKYRCTFCAFSKGRTHEHLRGKAYLLGREEIQGLARDAIMRGATEVCMQGGIHPAFTGETYLEICRAVKQVSPDIHIHAFSPLEVHHGASTLGLSLTDYLDKLKHAGLGSLPGTAAEILDDDIRRQICPDKISKNEWIEVVRSAHEVGLKTTSTIMFGHLESYDSWARHLLVLRTLQKQSGGLTEFVPLPFVHMEAPMYLRGLARPGPTYREVVLMHAVARIVLHGHIDNIQVSWPKLGPEGVGPCLQAGANDLGGTLMSESISKAAGAGFGNELRPDQMTRIAASLKRNIAQRTTLYGLIEQSEKAIAI
jgi:FO synthase